LFVGLLADERLDTLLRGKETLPTGSVEIFRAQKQQQIWSPLPTHSVNPRLDTNF